MPLQPSDGGRQIAAVMPYYPNRLLRRCNLPGTPVLQPSKLLRGCNLPGPRKRPRLLLSSAPPKIGMYHVPTALLNALIPFSMGHLQRIRSARMTTAALSVEGALDKTCSSRCAASFSSIGRVHSSTESNASMIVCRVK